mgnify:CR=1 FL=1
MAKKSNLKVVKNKKGKKPAFSKQELLKHYQDMLLLRRFEEKAGQMYGQGYMGGFCHLYIGQEAIVTGINAATNPDRDYTITTYRCHAHTIACGVDPKFVMAELMGRSGGISKGKGGSMHMFDPSKNFFGGHGIVAAQVPLGTGLAFAAKYREEDRICITYTGDGAMNGGQTYEAFNMAKLWDLPVLYIIENNQYAMGTSVARSNGQTELWRRGQGFGIEGEAVDGMDFFAVYEATKRAEAKVRKGEPYILEMLTYRYRGHSMSDPAKYRTKDEVEDMRSNKDPIAIMSAVLQEDYGVKQDALKEMDTKIKKQVEEAIAFAKNSPEPAEDQLWTDVMPEPPKGNE